MKSSEMMEGLNHFFDEQRSGIVKKFTRQLENAMTDKKCTSGELVCLFPAWAAQAISRVAGQYGPVDTSSVSRFYGVDCVIVDEGTDFRFLRKPKR